MRAYLIFTFLFGLMALPVLTLGAGLVPCEGIEDCSFNDLFTLMRKVMDFLIFNVAAPLAAIGFMWAGIKIVINPGNDGARKEAKKIFEYTLFGFVLVLGAYAIVKVIADVFIKESVVNL